MTQKHCEILKTDIILAIVLGIIAIISGKLNAHEPSYLILLSLFSLGTLWALFFLILMDHLFRIKWFKNNPQLILTVKSVIIAAALMLFICDILALLLTQTHINLFAIKAIMHKGFKETSGISESTYYTGLGLLLFIPLLVFFIIYKSQKIFITRIKTFRYFYLIFFVIILTERLATAYGNYYNYSSIKIINESIRWRPKSSMGRLMHPLLDYQVNVGMLPSSLKVGIDKTLDTNVKLPDIFFIMADGLRCDMVTSDIMPYLSQAEGTIFQNHYSTSNCTHFGTFSVLFGLFPNYYANAIDLGARPALIEFVNQLGYSTHAMSSYNFKWFGMDKLISQAHFDDITIFETPGYDFDQRDYEVIKALKKVFFKKKHPQFYYIALNSTHHNYYYPDNSAFNRFIPAISKNANLFSTDYKSKANQILNRYKNSALYVDHLIQELVDHIKKENCWENTIFIVFGDHGEEFFEEGHSLHASCLNRSQTSAALFIHTPHDRTHRNNDKTTSHIDILPTVMNIIKSYGLALQQPTWLKGQNILNDCLDAQRCVFSANAAERHPTYFAIHHGNKVCALSNDVFQDNTCKKMIKKYIDSFIQLTNDTH